MPPKTRRVKNSGPLKENVCVSIKSKSKNVHKNVKAPRKALADKTNSASDDNETVISAKVSSNTGKTLCVKKSPDTKNEQVHNVRPRRNRKLPDRFVENQILTNLHGNEDEKLNSITENDINDEGDCNSQSKKAVVILTPLKPHNKLTETSLADSRPKRICRLPSKFEDHSFSPNKYIPVQPIQASTPIVQNKSSKISSKIKITKDNVEVSRNLQKLQSRIRNRVNIKRDNLEENTNKNKDISIEKSIINQVQSTKPSPIKKVTQKTQKGAKENLVSNKKQADTNNNAKDLTKDIGLCIASSPGMNVNKNNNNGYRFLEKNYSFKVFDDKKKATKRDASTLDVYEFTYDPTEEPAPQKKKRKRAVQKKKEKPKTIYTNTYDKNVAKSLATLKNILLTKSSQTKPHSEKTVTETKTIQKNITSNQNLNLDKETKTATQQVNNVGRDALQKHYNSFQVEDIVLECEPVVNGHTIINGDINYSPVNSPNHVSIASEPKQGNNIAVEVMTTNKDPLNLQDDLSFFDECPAASSSMNVSTRDPSATPWRVEFGRLPIKWQVNTYVKPNMTPAFESSFINFSDNKSKHVYTNMVPEENGTLPEIIESNNGTNLKQPNIISFFKEVVDKSTNKNYKNKATPIKTNSIFEDITNASETAVTPVKQIASNKKSKTVTPKKKKSPDNAISSNTSVSDKENSIETMQNDKQKPQSNKKDNDVTFFGFDDSEEQDRENVSPNKKKCHIRALRPRFRAVLQELNVQTVPKRAVSKTEKNKNNDNAHNNKIFDDMIASNPPVSQENSENICENSKDINDAIIANSANLSGEDSQSVHLFEDLELLDVIHHVKPSRKSYGRSKKVTFRQNSVSSDTQESDLVEQNKSSEEEDNLDDLTFQVPTVEPKRTKRKKKPNKQFSKKEEKEADAWAADFNSMCEDVDEFDLVIE